MRARFHSLAKPSENMTYHFGVCMGLRYVVSAASSFVADPLLGLCRLSLNFRKASHGHTLSLTILSCLAGLVPFPPHRRFNIELSTIPWYMYMDSRSHWTCGSSHRK